MRNMFRRIISCIMVIAMIATAFNYATLVTTIAATSIEGRLITVGGKTVTDSMKIADVKKMFGEPKLETPSYWGGNAYTFYGKNYSDYLYLETNSDGTIVCYGSVSPGFETNVYNYGESTNNVVRKGCEAVDYSSRTLYGVIYYTKTNVDAYQLFGSNLVENNRNLCKHAVEMWNAISYIQGYNTPTYFDEQLFNINAQLAENYSDLYAYCNNTGKRDYYQLMNKSSIGFFMDYYYPNPLEFAQKAKNYKCNNGNAIGHFYYPANEEGSSYTILNGFVNKELVSDWAPVAYTARENELLATSREYYAKSVEDYNSRKTYYEIEPVYDSIETIEGGKLSEGIAKGAVGYLNAIRVGGGLNPLEYSEELSIAAQCKSTYTVYLSKKGISNPSPHYPPQVDGLSDEYYKKCQTFSGENLFMCGITSTDIIGSITYALDDSVGTGEYYSRGHRYNLLNPSWKYIGVGNTLQQGCHKMTGTQSYDVEVVSWPANGITISESGFEPSGMWTCRFYNGLMPTANTVITVKCLNNGTIWKINPNNLLVSQEFKVSGSLISYSDDSITFKDGGVYEITYENLSDGNGNNKNYSYRTVYENAYMASGTTEEVTAVELNETALEMVAGTTDKITAKIKPANVTNKRIYYTSDNPTVATVNECGEIIAHSAGRASITATSESGSVSAMCNVTVRKNGDDTSATDRIEGGIEINGYQVSATAKGMRTIYSVDDTIDGKKVVSSGIVYSLSDYAAKEELYVGSPSKYVENFQSTTVGKLGKVFSESDSATSYAMTMKFATTGAAEYNAGWRICAYAELEDGTYVYTKAYEYKIYDVANDLYQNSKMSTVEWHNYLYTDILLKVNKNYGKIEYNWNNSMV